MNAPRRSIFHSRPRDPEAPLPTVTRAALLYTAVRIGLFGIVFLLAIALVLPSTTGPETTRVIVCALIAAAVSIPASFFLAKRLREDLTLSLLAAKEARDIKDREYDERVRAARRGPGNPS